ncbi:hypothetical protein RhiirC2_787478 [Rhizophagus irregularis]|uniref:Uncharacterized protein n=1 Tax=Rhizophagus irregularis TaxID=588596 RepID=A0A2N1MS46_9GLOM|nr:hypothetical protein RhiirC2_787478 [Rhizophagus irregularis]
MWPNLQEIGFELANSIGKEIGSDLANPISKEISFDLANPIGKGNWLQFGYRNPARKSASICHPTEKSSPICRNEWELRNLKYTGFPGLLNA